VCGVAGDGWDSGTICVGVRVSSIWISCGNGSVVGENSTLGTRLDSGDLSEVSVTGLDDLRGVLHGSRSNGQSNEWGDGDLRGYGKSVGSYTESSTVSDVVGLYNLAVGVNV
jgi:hypothetical protein